MRAPSPTPRPTVEQPGLRVARRAVARALLARSAAAALALGGSARVLPAQDPPPAVQVFASGERGYDTFRIPAIVRHGATLLAFAEARLHAAHDSGNIDIVLKRSTDGGATWSELQVVADNGDGVFGNPTPVVTGTGAIALIVVRQPAGCTEADIRAGRRGDRTPYLLRSTDGGQLWSGPTALPDATRDDWRWYAVGPCHGHRIAEGAHAGRLVIPANHSVAGSGANSQFGAHLLLSDDDGRTWRLGAVDDTHVGDDALNPSECTVAALPEGALLVHTRDHHGTGEGTRAWATSRDGGESFAAPFAPLPEIVGPVCQGSLLAVRRGGRDLLVHSGPADPTARRDLRLRLSADGGLTWVDGPWVSARGQAAAYSDLVELADLADGGQDPAEGAPVGCLWEADGYRSILFTTVLLAPPDRR